MRIHSMSALTGAVAVSLVALLMSMQATRTASQLALSIDGPVEVSGIPTPQQMMVIRAPIPYTVPAGKLFVLTGLGSRGGIQAVQLRLDDFTELFATGPNQNYKASIVPVPPGFTVSEGHVIEVRNPASPGDENPRAYGYLVDA